MKNPDKPEDFRSILPNNATQLELAVEGATQLDKIPVGINDIYSPDLVPQAFLPWMAWQVAVNDYDPGYPEGVKRNLIRNSYILHAHKGTKWAIKEALSLIGVTADLSEWYQYGAPPYYFRMEVNLDAHPDGLFTEQMYYDFFRTVYDKKNARSWLDTLRMQGRFDVSLFSGVGLRNKIHIEIPLDKAKNRRFRTSIGILNGLAKFEECEIKTKRTYVAKPRSRVYNTTIPIYYGRAVYESRNIESPMEH